MPNPLDPKQGPLGRQLAAHLLRRATFGPSKAEIDQFSTLSAQQALDILLAPSNIDNTGFNHNYPPPPVVGGNTSWLNGGSNGGKSDFYLQQYITGWYIDESFDNSPPHLAHKIVFYLYTIFAVDHNGNSGLGTSQDHYNYLRLFRYYSNRSIRDLAWRVIMDKAMIRYLNSDQSVKGKPNENFARELLELFTIGKGPQIGPNNYTTYTETDIQQAARIFTGIKGWTPTTIYHSNTDIPRGTVNTSQHDTGAKTFTAAFGNITIPGRSTEADIINLEFWQFIVAIFNQAATAKNYMRKLYRLFVHADITEDIENDIIAPLALDFQTNNFDLTVPLRRLLESEHFYDAAANSPGAHVIGGIIKSPLDLLVGIMRFFKVNPPNVSGVARYDDFYRVRVYNHLLMNGDMDLFSPPSVAGHNAYHQAPSYSKAWISPNTLAFRYRWADMFFDGRMFVNPWNAQADSLQMQLQPAVFVRNDLPNPADPNALVDNLLTNVFSMQVDANRRNYFVNVLLNGAAPGYWTNEWNNYVNTNNDSIVAPRLKALIRGIIQSPEYQLM